MFNLKSFLLVALAPAPTRLIFRPISTTPFLFQYSNTTPHQKKVRYQEKICRRRQLNQVQTSRINPVQEDIALDEKIELSSDGRVICCWHPESKLEEWKYDYKFTKPITDGMRTETFSGRGPGIMSGNDIEQKLKVQALRPIQELFRPKSERLMVRELMGITHTAKYTWFKRTRRRDRYREADKLGLIEKRDREGL